jgi:P pilus assembly chaperone PapD
MSARAWLDRSRGVACALGMAIALGAALAPATCGAQILAQVTPVKYNLTTKRSDPISRDVQVANLGDEPVVVHVRLSDWTLSEDGQLSLAPLGSTPVTLEHFVRFEPTQFSLGPGESGLIHVTLQLPIEGPPTRWGVLLSEVRPAVPKPSNLGPRAIAELGTTLYLSSVEPETVTPELTGLDVAALGGDSLEVAVHMKNAGDRHYYVSGDLAIADSTGAQVASGTFGTGVVLPGGKRIFTWTCTTPLKPGRYSATATLDTGQPELMVGETRFRWPVPARPSGPVAERSPH